MKRRVYRSARLTLFFPLAVFVAALCWCFSLSDSSVLILAELALTATLVSFHRERIIQIWRQTVVLENDRLIYFDGQTRHEIRFAEMKLIRLNRWVGTMRQSAGHSLALMPQGDQKIEHWDLSDFSLRVVLRLVCELARRADWPAIEIYQTEFQNLKAELFGAVRGLGALASIDLGAVDEASLSFYEKEFRQRERCYLFTPHH